MKWRNLCQKTESLVFKHLINIFYLWFFLLASHKQAILVFTVGIFGRFPSRSTYHIYSLRFMVAVFPHATPSYFFMWEVRSYTRPLHNQLAICISRLSERGCPRRCISSNTVELCRKQPSSWSSRPEAVRPFIFSSLQALRTHGG